MLSVIAKQKKKYDTLYKRYNAIFFPSSGVAERLTFKINK